MIDKKNRMQDRMLDKKDETTGEIREQRTDLQDHIEMRFARIETELAEVKKVLREKGII